MAIVFKNLFANQNHDNYIVGNPSHERKKKKKGKK